MRTRADLEAYLKSSGQSIEEVSDDTWLVHDPYDPGKNVVVKLSAELVIFRLKVLELSQIKKKRTELFQKLLEINAAEMLSGAYGLSNDAVVLTTTLRLENLDMSEFQATLDDFQMAIGKHYSQLAAFRDSAN